MNMIQHVQNTRWSRQLSQQTGGHVTKS